MTDPHDLSGVWYGRYFSYSDDQENSFIALIEESGDAVTGTITEPDEIAGEIRRAVMWGRRTGPTVAFTKQYAGRWDHSVAYRGKVDEEGTHVTGTWSVDWVNGSFDMRREKFDIEELEEAEQTEVPAGFTLPDNLL